MNKGPHFKWQQWLSPFASLVAVIVALVVMASAEWLLLKHKYPIGPFDEDSLRLISALSVIVLTGFLAHLIYAMSLSKDLMEKFKSETLAQERKLATDLNKLVNDADVCGLARVYANRTDASSAVTAAIAAAEKQIWLLGIAFSQCVSLDGVMREFVRKKNYIKVPGSRDESKPLDVRILLLDPFRSPAVFRTFLESDRLDISRIVGVKKDGPYGLPRDDDLVNVEQLLKLTLYSHLNRAADMLTYEANKFLQPMVRFYAHNPSCWLVVTEKLAFFEPYTFGQPEEPDGQCIGKYFPVFEFRQGGEPYKVLRDHLDKMWRTTNVSFYHFEARNREEVKRTLLNSILKARSPWLRAAHLALVYKGEERRAWPHDFCPGHMQVTVRPDSKNKSYSATILDSSRRGMGLEIHVNEKEWDPQEGEIINLIELSADEKKKDPLSAVLMERFVNRKLFVVYRQWSASKEFVRIGVYRRRRKDNVEMRASPEASPNKECNVSQSTPTAATDLPSAGKSGFSES
jgi:hypothetical protein